MSNRNVPTRARRSLERELAQRVKVNAKARKQRIRQEVRAAKRLMTREHLSPDTISGRAALAFLNAYTKVEPGSDHLQRAEAEALRTLEESDLKCMTSVCRGLERAKSAVRQVLSQRNGSTLRLVTV